MVSLKLPLAVGPKGLEREENVKESITSFLNLLLESSPGVSSVADSDFGFILNSLIFENFNENEDVISRRSGIYGKKISGNSRNLNTFASELQILVSEYETRLSDVSVSMIYSREERVIYVTIKGCVKESGEQYQYDSKIKVWK